MSGKTTIQVSTEVKDLLEAKKDGNESLDDVLKRELNLESDDDVVDLTMYLSDDTASEVESFIDLLSREFDFVQEYSEVGESGYPELEFRHPESEMPLVKIEASEDDSYAAYYRSHSGDLRSIINWGGSFDADEQDQVDDILRRVRGAYQKYG